MSNQRPVFFTSTTASGSASADYTHVKFSLQFKAGGQTAAEATKACEESVVEFQDLLYALKLEDVKISQFITKPHVLKHREYDIIEKRHVDRGFMAVYLASFQIKDVHKAVDVYARLVELKNVEVGEPVPTLSSSSLQALQKQAFQKAFSQAKKCVDDELLAISEVMKSKSQVKLKLVSYIPSYNHPSLTDDETSHTHTRATIATMSANTASKPTPFELGQAKVTCTVTVHWQKHILSTE